jgi:aspartate-semialdehyde dehydrogenase
LIGADSLLGRELRERFTAAAFHTRLQSATLEKDASAVFAATEDDIEVVPAVDELMVNDALAIIAANSAAEALQFLTNVHSHTPLLVLSEGLDAHAGAALRAPRYELRPVQSAIHIIPQPGTILIDSFLDDLHSRHPLRRSVVTLFEPASQSGRQAIDELQKQTISLLSFKPLPKTHFDSQLAFNLLPRTGEESKISLPSREARICDELIQLHSFHPDIPIPSLRLVHAPTFHGYSASVWVEFASRPNLPEIIQELKAEGIDVRDESLDPPTNTGAAGQSGYAVGAIEADRNQPNAAWFWLAADNLRLQADVTIDVLRELLLSN